ncbi:hypothetical protein F5148DRAFT_1281607 [Russula earlei]|uniref:Uncharacterized protein n=1 Tax=Russula earlei TaxID=71964 RepID=A0ACC0UGG5_9AGAM|nr:hypothetical protein F5148DRAFT_1281607 [Russula earlei]
MKAFSAILLILSLRFSVLAQQLITTTNAAGNTIVEQITTNAFGQSLTQVLQTLGPGGAATTSTALTSPTISLASVTTQPTSRTAATAATTTQGQQGPVGQPGTTPTTPGGPTPFTYTTTDASGNTLVTTGVFTPAFPATTPYTPTFSGTVLPYSVWLSMVGGNTATGTPGASQAVNSNAASHAGVNGRVVFGAASMAIIGLIGRSL